MAWNLQNPRSGPDVAKDNATVGSAPSGISRRIVRFGAQRVRQSDEGVAMKMITAIIRPYKLDDLELAVAQIGVQGMTVMEVQGYGAQHGHAEIYRGAAYRVEFVPRVQVLIAVDESIVEPVIEAIANVTRTGKVGDGRIFVADIEQAIRIRTGETGVSAT
jgi:nitrogen regulatory protein PII